jgi:hypothetical protein
MMIMTVCVRPSVLRTTYYVLYRRTEIRPPISRRSTIAARWLLCSAKPLGGTRRWRSSATHLRHVMKSRERNRRLTCFEREAVVNGKDGSTVCVCVRAKLGYRYLCRVDAVCCMLYAVCCMLYVVAMLGNITSSA